MLLMGFAYEACCIFVHTVHQFGPVLLSEHCPGSGEAMVMKNVKEGTKKKGLKLELACQRPVGSNVIPATPMARRFTVVHACTRRLRMLNKNPLRPYMIDAKLNYQFKT